MYFKKRGKDEQRYKELFDRAFEKFLEQSSFRVTDWLDDDDAQEFDILTDKLFGEDQQST